MNNNQDPKPIIPFKPQIENNPNQPITTNVNQEELIAKIEDIIPPKKSKTKIILTTLIAFLLLGSVAGAVFLVRQNQDIREQAADICANIGDSCTDDYPEACTTTDGKAGTRQCHKVGTCKGVGGGDQCSWGDGSSCDACTANDPGTTKECENSTDCPQICHFNKCRNCSDIGDASTCATHDRCAWVNNSCQLNTTPPPSGDCTPTVTGSGGGLCGVGSSTSVKITACLPDTCSGLTSELKLSFNSVSANCAGSTYANDCNTVCGNAGSTSYITFPSGSQKGACQDLTASCTVPNACGACQVDIRGNGANVGERVNDSSGCTTPTPTRVPTGTPTPTPTTISCQCDLIKAYSTTWTLLTSADLAALKPGDKVRFAAKGTTTSGTIDKIRYKINNGAFIESIIKKPGTNEFYYEYTIPANTTSFSVSAEVHHKELNKWF